jgi:hypothetical protein
MVERLRRVQSTVWLIYQQSADQVEEALNVWVLVLINTVTESTCLDKLYQLGHFGPFKWQVTEE